MAGQAALKLQSRADLDDMIVRQLEDVGETHAVARHRDEERDNPARQPRPPLARHDGFMADAIGHVVAVDLGA